MFEEKQIVTITGNGEATRYKHGWGSGMDRMLGKSFVIDHIYAYKGVSLYCKEYDCYYTWDQTDLTLTSELKDIVKMSSKIKSSKIDVNILDI